MKVKLIIALLAALVLPPEPSQAEVTSIGPEAADSHIGKIATVCGEVASTRYADRSKGTPTFLNLGAPYPDQLFTALFWKEHREAFVSAFGPPEVSLQGQVICVSGEIQLYKGLPQIILVDPSELTVH